MLKLKLKLKLLTTPATMSRSTPRQLKKLAMPVGVSRTVEDFGELLPDPKLSAEREYQLLQIPLGDGRFELVSTSLVEIEYY